MGDEKEINKEVERRVEQAELKLALDQVKIIVSQTSKDVRDILASLYGGDGKEGFIGETTTALTVQKESISRLWWWVGGISLSIVALCFFIIKFELSTKILSA